ncbi:alpha/beta hydrolase [Sphingomonas sp. Leaf25]|uniref:alpha/beta hydrolase n=1 Tax=Sphingomonas sp. Leaf25 TaxID=1735692 RepID=UPI000B22527A|nr:alpha/beta hydrolase [Sphingomonas sp. Leaf25]
MVAIAAPAGPRILALIDGAPPMAMADAIDRLRATLLPIGRATDGDRNILGAKIDRFVGDGDAPVILMAHGAGCRAAAWWARLSPAHYVQRVAGAILVDPVAEAGHDRFASPSIALPFRSVTVDHSPPAMIAALAREWGSELVDDREEEAARGRRLLRIIERLSGAVVAHDVRTARKLARLG